MSALHGIWRKIRRATGGRRALGVHVALVLVIILVAVLAAIGNAESTPRNNTHAARKGIAA